MSILASHKKAVNAARREAVAWIDALIDKEWEWLDESRKLMADNAQRLVEESERSEARGKAEAFKTAAQNLIELKKKILGKFG